MDKHGFNAKDGTLNPQYKKKVFSEMSQYGTVGHSFDVYAVVLNSNLIPVTGKIIFRCPEYNSTLYQPLSTVT